MCLITRKKNPNIPQQRQARERHYKRPNPLGIYDGDQDPRPPNSIYIHQHSMGSWTAKQWCQIGVSELTFSGGHSHSPRRTASTCLSISHSSQDNIPLKPGQHHTQARTISHSRQDPPETSSPTQAFRRTLIPQRPPQADTRITISRKTSLGDFSPVQHKWTVVQWTFHLTFHPAEAVVRI